MQYLIVEKKEKISTTQDGNLCKCLFFTVIKSFYLELPYIHEFKSHKTTCNSYRSGLFCRVYSPQILCKGLQKTEVFIVLPIGLTLLVPRANLINLLLRA